MSLSKHTAESFIKILRALPRLSLCNVRNTPGVDKKSRRGRGQHGGDTHGSGQAMSKKRQNYMRLGYETGNNPFYLRFPREPYYKGHHLRRQYPPVSMLMLQRWIDTNRVDPSKPIDLAAICNSGLYSYPPDERYFGVHLTDEGADLFKAKVNVEVQWATEHVIAAIERNGGVITTAYYDINALWALRRPMKFFEKGEAIPRRMQPPADAVLFYSSAINRGYLADPEQVSLERLVLAQKYGYELPRLEDDPDYEMLTERKDPRQIFYGLEPGWVVSLRDKVILKPKDPQLKEFYKT